MKMRKSAEERKNEIMASALRLADELGPDSLSVEAIARDVGLTQPGVFRHFPTKQAIWEAVTDTITDRMIDGWNTVYSRGGQPVEQLRELILTQFRFIHTTPAIPAILFSRELHAKNNRLRETVFNLLAQFHQAIASQVTKAQDAGTFRRDFNVNDVSFLLIGLVQGLAVRWSLSGRSFVLIDEGARLLDIQIQLFTTPYSHILEDGKS
ncbi:TetR/AcrR family transcriptional regulator [Pseudochrobactrum lubricantis]|uniref:TetR/AcrR family transcriptional regulator n=1 Tax=Pseudochrobactrum lubricantis TaxID=558172 RepID=UPI0035DB3DB2